MKPGWIELTPHTDSRGCLVAVESGRDLPFEMRRVYSMSGMPIHSRRGAHAHRVQRQVIVALKGGCRVWLDNGRERAEAILDSPLRGLILEPMVWHEIGEFSPDCMLLVFADAHYDAADVISDLAEFRRLAGEETRT